MLYSYDINSLAKMARAKAGIQSEGKKIEDLPKFKNGTALMLFYLCFV